MTLQKRLCLLPVVLVIILASRSPASGQSGASLSGQVLNSLTTEPVAEAVVLIEGLDRRVRTDAAGRYTFESVAPGPYRLVVRAPGFFPRRVDITVSAASPPLDVTLDPELRLSEVVSVSPEARDPLQSYQPTSVLIGADLSIQLAGTLGATLKAQPGVSERSFGPGPSRPVIRGLDGDRVLVLEDGQRLGDLSGQSADHGVMVNPAAASRIEIVRGPATLLYGANAIGGVVNVISDVIPAKPVTNFSGGVSIEAGSAAREVGSGADFRWGNGHWAVSGSGSGRRSGDVHTPRGTVENAQTHGGFGSVGGSWTSDRAYLGGSFRVEDTEYGIPVIEGGNVRLTPRRRVIGLRGGGSGFRGAFESVRAWFAHRRYRHEEGEAGLSGTLKQNDTDEFDVQAKHHPLGRMAGTVGGWLLDRRYVVTGEEALSPSVDERAFAAYLYEELTWERATVQAGGRLDRASYVPDDESRPRAFTDFSGSLGLVVRPALAGGGLTVALSLARASRYPGVEDLYFFGPHHTVSAFDIGNDALDPEHALGVDAALRWRSPRITGEVAFFRNHVDGFIFRAPVSDDAFEARYGPLGHEEDHADTATAAHQDDEAHEEGDLPFFEFTAADSLLQGVETSLEISLTPSLALDLGLDYVRGELRSTGESLPRMPPRRVRAGLRYRVGGFQAGGEVTRISAQDRVFHGETPTGGATLLRVFAAHAVRSGRTLQTLAVGIDNLANELYRNHLSFIKDVVPEIGRNLKVTYTVGF